MLHCIPVLIFLQDIFPEVELLLDQGILTLLSFDNSAKCVIF